MSDRWSLISNAVACGTGASATIVVESLFDLPWWSMLIAAATKAASDKALEEAKESLKEVVLTKRLASALKRLNPWLSAALLAAAAVYQITPLKHACLKHCRTPFGFIMGHWRPGASGAFRMGLVHGTYCVGCCWFLMALLFVGGIMNIVWIAGLALMVLVEKVAPNGRLVSNLLGVLFLGGAIHITASAALQT